jgi:hypothetical protein
MISLLLPMPVQAETPQSVVTTGGKLAVSVTNGQERR